MTLLAESSPSNKAIEAADLALIHNLGVGKWVKRGDAFYVLRAAHNPALGLDRSVCLRDVVAWLRTEDGPTTPHHDIADAIEREFGGVQ